MMVAGFPNLVGSVGWTSPTSRGSAFTPIPYVSGFQAGLTASKRLDPLVVFLGASYFSSASLGIAGDRHWFPGRTYLAARIEMSSNDLCNDQWGPKIAQLPWRSAP